MVWKTLAFVLSNVVTDPNEKEVMLSEFEEYPDEFPPKEKNESNLNQQKQNERKEKDGSAQEKANSNKPIQLDFKFDESSSEGESEEELSSFILNQENESERKNVAAPKHLYDCLLGLRSENKERFEISMKNLPYLVRKKLNDLNVLAIEIITVVLKSEHNNFNIEKFNEYREKAVISLIIMDPERISE